MTVAYACGQPQPGHDRRRCDLPDDHKGRHETWVVPGETRVWWYSDKSPARYRQISETERLDWLNEVGP